MKNTFPTICAISTAPGSGAIALIRLSGNEAIEIANTHIQLASGKPIENETKGSSIHFGNFIENGIVVDEIIVSVFRNPASYTGEDLVEISCHGSVYIQQIILKTLIDSGAQLANPGEFTQRAFLNGKMDLSQAEGVADLIASESKAAHSIALDQMKGGFSKALQELRHQLLQLISLIELELDFSEEDVEFADRVQLKRLIQEIQDRISELIESFQYGNAIKEGVPVVIAGNPNVGKSTLLNHILKDEKAIVSEIAGTTRDSIEDVCIIKGIQFRFIDTAGLRKTEDTIEKIGIERSYAKIKKSKILLYLLDLEKSFEDLQEEVRQIEADWQEKSIVFLINKLDKDPAKAGKISNHLEEVSSSKIMGISAKNGENVEELLNYLVEENSLSIQTKSNVIVSNVRHYEALKHAYDAGLRFIEGMEQGMPTDLIAEDLRQILHYLGEITGTISNDEILGNIFSQFCIGK